MNTTNTYNEIMKYMEFQLDLIAILQAQDHDHNPMNKLSFLKHVLYTIADKVYHMNLDHYD